MIRVVAGIIFRADGSFLLAQRPSGKVYSGFWEFPGGKIEPHESAEAALARELEEELGIVPTSCYPWVTKNHHYEHGHVNIQFFKVTEWSGELQSRESQKIKWQTVGRIDVEPLLAPNIPVIRSLGYPSVYLITNLQEMGEDSFFKSLRQAVLRNPFMIQIREKNLSSHDLEVFSKEVIKICRSRDIKILINGDELMASRVFADGVHVNSVTLNSIQKRPEFPICAASCHSKKELQKAEQLGFDFAVLSPVSWTASHPDSVPLGWDVFQSEISGIGIPIFALGGMSPSDLTSAWARGAAGISMMRACW